MLDGLRPIGHRSRRPRLQRQQCPMELLWRYLPVKTTPRSRDFPPRPLDAASVYGLISANPAEFEAENLTLSRIQTQTFCELRNVDISLS
jgi:hypothetical protein